MDLKKEYQKLYDKWLQEFEQLELTPLNEEEFNFYKTIVETVTNVELEDETGLKVDLLVGYKKNITFLFEDLLKLREVKVMNSALVLKDLDINNLTEAEKLLYQNLVATIKGYKKVKAFNIAIHKEGSAPKTIIETILQPIEDLEDTETRKNSLAEEMFPATIEQSLIKAEEEAIEYQYTLIRFINKTPPLVGVDLKSYGPFEENNIANIPFQNAIILINEKYAEKIEIT